MQEEVYNRLIKVCDDIIDIAFYHIRKLDMNDIYNLITKDIYTKDGIQANLILLQLETVSILKAEITKLKNISKYQFTQKKEERE